MADTSSKRAGLSMTTYPSSRARCVAAGFLLLASPWRMRGAPTEQGSFAVDDYFGIRRVTELALSANGERLAYVVESPVLSENRTDRVVYVSGVEKNANPRQIEKLAGARDLAWVPG